MKFRIVTVCNSDPERVINEYPVLNEFEFKSVAIPTQKHIRIKDENGKTIFQSYPSERNEGYVTIHTIDQLLEFCRAVENPIIISVDRGSGDAEIEIYDNYRE